MLTFHFRGSWGSPGEFSIAHEIEDVQAAIALLRVPANATKLGIDRENIVLVGHSVGGLAASIVGAADPAIRGVAIISAVDLGGYAYQGKAAVAGFLSADMNGLHGATPELLADEIISNKVHWALGSQARGLAQRPVLIVTADDGLAQSSDAFASDLKAQSGKVTVAHFATDHSYSGERIAMESAVIRWLNNIIPIVKR